MNIRNLKLWMVVFMHVSNSSTAAAVNKAANYILIHGAWHGSWCWNKITPRLQNLGHKVITPDLPGHYTNPADFKSVTLQHYVDHIQSLIEKATEPVVLVGHSMAGVVATQVAENMPDKINRLIYISGFIPQNGGALLDEEKQAFIPTVGAAITVDEANASIALPLHTPERVIDLFYGRTSEADAKYALSHLQKQPLIPFVNPIRISEARFGAVPKLYIECFRDKAILVQDQRRMHAKTNCAVASIDTDHSPFFSTPDELVRVLTSVPKLARKAPAIEDLR